MLRAYSLTVKPLGSALKKTSSARCASRFLSTFKNDYDGAVAERAAIGVVPKPLDVGELS